MLLAPGCERQPSGSPSIQAPPSSTPTTTDVSEVRAGVTAHLSAVRLARRAGHDRLVFEFADRVPGYTAGYRPLPARADASGEEIPLPGSGALLQVTLTPATAAGWGDGERTYFGPSTVAANTAAVTEVKAAGDFEAMLTWAVGLRAEAPFQVLVLDGPPRLVVDFQHP
jgi:hypothetical protein